MKTCEFKVLKRGNIITKNYQQQFMIIELICEETRLTVYSNASSSLRLC